MSYDLLIFKGEDAPRDKNEFKKWYEELVDWKSEYDYHDYKQSDEAIQAFFLELIETFPPMNGPLALESMEEDSYATDYSIGENFIYCGFSWLVFDTAGDIVKSLAKKHHLGFFGISDYQEILYNDESKKQKFRLLENAYLLTDEAEVDDIIGCLNSLEEGDFIILDSLKPINDNIYIQTMKENDKYTVETRFEVDDDFKHYQITMNEEDVKEVFSDYRNSKCPNITKWEDITQSLKDSQPRILN